MLLLLLLKYERLPSFQDVKVFQISGIRRYSSKGVFLTPQWNYTIVEIDTLIILSVTAIVRTDESGQVLPSRMTTTHQRMLSGGLQSCTTTTIMMLAIKEHL